MCHNRLVGTNHLSDRWHLWKSTIRHLNWPAFARERVPFTNADTKSWDCRANPVRGSEIKTTPAPQPERLGDTQFLMGCLLGAQRTLQKGRWEEWEQRGWGTPWQQGHLNQREQSSDELPETEAACTRPHSSAPDGVLELEGEWTRDHIPDPETISSW